PSAGTASVPVLAAAASNTAEPPVRTQINRTRTSPPALPIRQIVSPLISDSTGTEPLPAKAPARASASLGVMSVQAPEKGDGVGATAAAVGAGVMVGVGDGPG